MGKSICFYYLVVFVSTLQRTSGHLLYEVLAVCRFWKDCHLILSILTPSLCRCLTYKTGMEYIPH